MSEMTTLFESGGSTPTRTRDENQLITRLSQIRNAELTSRDISEFHPKIITEVETTLTSLEERARKTIDPDEREWLKAEWESLKFISEDIFHMRLEKICLLPLHRHKMDTSERVNALFDFEKTFFNTVTEATDEYLKKSLGNIVKSHA